MNVYSSPSTPDDLAQELACHLDFLRRLARTLVRDEQIAEDMVQETMLAAIARRPSPSMGLQVWLKSVLRRSVLLHFRKEQRRMARESLLLRESSGADSVASEAEQAMASFEQASMLGKAVARLNDPYRTVIILRYYEGLKPKEIATRLDRSVHTVNTQLQRGLHKLRDVLDEASDGQRRVWVSALLPHAIHGSSGWWPYKVSYGTGLSSSVAFVLAAVLLACAGVWLVLRSESSTPPAILQTAQAPATESAFHSLGGDLEEPPVSRRTAEQPSMDPSEEISRTPFRLQVRSDQGPIPGARVVAKQRSSYPPKLSRISSSVPGANGKSLKIRSGGLRLPKDPPDEDDLASVEGTTDLDGRVELDLTGDRAWTLRAEAVGFAPGVLDLSRSTSREGQVVELETAAQILVSRGSFPLHYNVYVQLNNEVEELIQNVILVGGEQEVRIDNLRAGSYLFEALSSGGVEVAQWNQPITIAHGQTARVDLSGGDVAPLQVSIVGASADAPPLFANAHGPYMDAERPSWSQFVAVHNGLADFEGVPVGPGVIRILSRETEIARVSYQVVPGGGMTRVEVPVRRGKLRVVHPGRNGVDMAWMLVKRSDGEGSIDGWRDLGEPLRGREDSWYHGLSAGTYRLWISHGASTRVWDLEHDGDFLEVEARIDVANEEELVGLRVVRGVGIHPEAPIELEYRPGIWASIRSDGAQLRLAPGEYRLRVAMLELGYATRTVELPNQTSVTFEEPAPLRRVEVSSMTKDTPRVLSVESKDVRSFQKVKRSLPLKLDSNGVGWIELRPGDYEVYDRWGITGELKISADEDLGRLTFD